MDFAAGVYLSEAQDHTVYSIHIYTEKGGGDGESGTREKVRGATVESKIPT